MLIGPSARRPLLRPNRISLKLVAVALGVLAGGIAIVLFNAWLQTQGRDEASLAAAGALQSAEMRLRQTVDTLSDLSARGVDSCRPSHLEAMRQAALVSGPIKDVMLIAPNGEIMCADAGGLLGRLSVSSSAATAAADVMLDVMLDVMQRSDRGERFVRVRKLGDAGKPGIAALLPASLLIPHEPLPGMPMPGLVRLTLSDGTLVAESGAAPSMEGAPILRRMQSQQYPFAVTAVMARNGVIATSDDLRRIATAVSAAFALLVLFAALRVFRRQPDNPIAEMAKAILADEFVPYYQPIVDIQTGRLLGAEVLARWRRADGTLVEPIAFVSLMESSGLVSEFTRSLMRRARDELGAAVGRRPDMTIAFNVAPQHFDDALILHDVGTIFDGSPIKLNQIVLELTEHYRVKNLTGMRRAVAALQGLGCKIAIDDIGTGHNGLSYILKLGVDIIKIDKVFVEAIGAEGQSRAIIDMLIDLAKNMRMEIVAEGVETFDQVTYLRERGITAAQGYVFSPPLSAASFLQLLDAMDPAADAPGGSRVAARVAGAAPSAAAGRQRRSPV